MRKSGTCVRWATTLFLLVAGPTLSAALAQAEPEPVPDLSVPAVIPVVETVSVDAGGDAADDAAIWRHPDDPAQSLIIATDKQTGLVVYDLQGRQRQALPVGRLNNVDVRTVDGVPIVVASNRSDATLTTFLIDPQTAQLREAGRIATIQAEPYGLCLHLDVELGTLFAVVPDKTGAVPVYSLWFDGTRVKGSHIYDHKVPSQAEGCVADDRTGALYVGEENGGIWRLEAVPPARKEAGDPVRAPILFARVDADGLTADVEGLTLVPDDTETGGLLIASSQGDSTYAVFDLDSLNLTARFRIGPNTEDGIDAVTETDGIDAIAADLGGAFASGLFIAQDDVNDTDDPAAPAHQNFKLVPLDRITALLP